MTKRLLSITIFMLLIGVGSAFAHEHKVMGTVTMAASDHLMIKTTAGKEATVKIVADTKVTRGKETVKPESIKEGTRVVVTTASDTAPYTAIAVEVGPDPKPSTTRKQSQDEEASHETSDRARGSGGPGVARCSARPATPCVRDAGGGGAEARGVAHGGRTAAATGRINLDVDTNPAPRAAARGALSSSAHGRVDPTHA